MKSIKISHIILIAILFFSVKSWSSVDLVELSPQQILSYAETAAGSKYKLGYSHWDPKNKSWGGVDCGGLVQKAWRWPKALSYKERMRGSYRINGKRVPGKLFTGAMLENKKRKLPWTVSQDIGQARIGDSLTFYNGGKYGHTILVAGTEKNGRIKSLEARSARLGVGYFQRTKSELKAKRYKLLRRQNMRNSTPLKKVERKPTQQAMRYHSVRAGDTVWGISRQHKVSVGHMIKLNPELRKNPDLIRIGDRLRVR